jgi:hypothetical protein
VAADQSKEKREEGSTKKRGVLRGLAASAAARKKERPVTQINFEEVVTQQQEQQEQSANANQPPIQVEERRFERKAQREREEKRLARDRDEQKRDTREEQETLAEQLAKQWKDRPLQRKIIPRKKDRPLTHFDFVKVINSESPPANKALAQPSPEKPASQATAENERQPMAGQDGIGNPTHGLQPATDNSNSKSASGKIPEHTTNSKEPVQAMQVSSPLVLPTKAYTSADYPSDSSDNI